MRLIGFGADIAIMITGIVILMYGYRLLGKPPSADEKSNDEMSRRAFGNRIIGWSIIVTTIIGLVSRLAESFW